jgi:hypothetical protein
MAEERTSVWEYINPVHMAGDYFQPFVSPTSAFIYGPYRALARGRAFFPGLVPTEGWIGIPGQGFSRIATGAWSRMTSPAFRAGSTGRFIGTTGRFLMFGGEQPLGIEARVMAKYGPTGARAYWFKKADALRGLGKDRLVSLIERRAINPTVSVFAKAGLIGAARVVSPILNLYAAYQATSWAIETAYKGIKTTSEIINRAADQISKLELGGDLSRGFLSDQAATERQRALQAIQSSHLSGRRFLGNEASLYHE